MILTKKQLFTDASSKDNLANKAVNNGIITIIEQMIRLILQVSSTSILARYITPDSYGLISMVAVVTNFVAIFKDVGLSIITIQKEHITESESSNLFWINVALSTALGVLVALFSPIVSWFYGRSELIGITIYMGIALAISGISMQHQALLKRNLRFDSIFVINIASYFISLVVMVVMAIYGYEYTTLVVGTLVQNILITLITFFCCRWIPQKYDKHTKIGSMVKFGINVTTFEFVNYFTRNLDNILIGKYCGSEQLGLYSKAYQIVYMPINRIRAPINNVALPIMAKVSTDSQRLRRYFKIQTMILSIIVIPLMMGIFSNARDSILLLFGENWLQMEFVFKVLSFVAIFQPVFSASGTVFMALGRADLHLRAGIYTSACTVISFIIGVNYGVNGVAVAYACSSIITQFISFAILFKNSAIKLYDLVEGVLPTTVSAIIACVLCTLIKKHIVISGLFFRFIFSFSTLYIIFICLMLVIPTGRAQLLYIINLILSKFKLSKKNQ